LSLHGGYWLVGEATRHDEREEIQVGAHVQSEAVGGDATRDVYAERRDLGLWLITQRVSPNPGESFDSLRGDAEIATSADEHLFQPPHEFHRPKLGLEAAQIEDGIGHQLSGTMEGHIAAAVDVEQLHPALGQELG